MSVTPPIGSMPKIIRNLILLFDGQFDSGAWRHGTPIAGALLIGLIRYHSNSLN